MTEDVLHQEHYTRLPLQPIMVMLKDLAPAEFMGFLKGNLIKYTLRADGKNVLEDYAKAGYTIIGLAGEGDVDISGVPGVNGPVLVVVGSEGEGLSRLVRTHCDVLARIPISSAVESLNASVATSVALYEIGRCRGSLSS